MKGKNIPLALLLFLSQMGWSQQNEPVYFEGFAQGTTYHITYFDAQDRFLQRQVDSILNDFDFSVSTYNPKSVISKINRNEATAVDGYFKVCFAKGKSIWKATKGAFDPTVYSLVNGWGFGPGKKQKLDQQKIDSILVFTGFEKIKLKGDQVIKKDPRVKLDFNAFAQGYSVDVIARYLEQMGITSYLVEIGGEVYAHGRKPDGSFWTVGIEQPIDNKTEANPNKAIVRLENLAIATSGNYRKFTVENGVKLAHHIDPKTGYPTKNNLLSASVFSKECITSDATATGLLVMGLEKAKAYLAKHREIEAYLIYSDDAGRFQVYETPGLREILSEVQP